MVERITLLEPHFDGAQFGPSNIDSGTFEGLGETERGKTSTTDESNGKSRATMVIQGLIGFVLMFVVLYASLRALSSDDEEAT